MTAFSCRRVTLCLAIAVLHGCASPDTTPQLSEAQAAYDAVSADPRIMRDAPMDVTRAGESLERANRLASYLGSSEDARHYAYLSQRYGEIARLNSELMQNRQRATQLAMEQARLQRTLQDAKAVSLQQSQTPEEDLFSLAAEETERGPVMTLGDLHFRDASAELNPSVNRTLLKLAHFLQLNPSRRVRVEGYTDSRGDAAQNLQLSQSRAQSVVDFLQELGIDPGRLEAIGYGEQHPISENASARGRAQNRRVEILFSDRHGQLGELR